MAKPTGEYTVFASFTHAPLLTDLGDIVFGVIRFNDLVGKVVQGPRIRTFDGATNDPINMLWSRYGAMALLHGPSTFSHLCSSEFTSWVLQFCKRTIEAL